MCSVDGCPSKAHVWDGPQKAHYCVKCWTQLMEAGT